MPDIVSPGALALGIVVRQWRENEVDRSQRWVAARLGMSEGVIYQIEHGTYQIKLELLIKLARVMDKPPLELAAIYFMENTKQEEQEPPANKSDAAAKRARDADTLNQLRKRKEKEQTQKDKEGLIKN